MDFIIKKPKSSNRTIRMPDELIEQIGTLAGSRAYRLTSSLFNAVNLPLPTSRIQTIFLKNNI
ncbi:MAG: hypothetical protein U0M60_11975 [Clostridia bacterium]|nr:hypothetical protein [Clostridia bacterium]